MRLRARALLGLGRLAAMEGDLERMRGKAGEALRACWLLGTDRPREALALADTLLAPVPAARARFPELVAVRAAAASQLGRPGPVGEITDETIARLRRKGFSELADRLAPLAREPLH